MGNCGVWVANAYLRRIDPATNRVGVIIPLAGEPHSVTVDGNDVWVSVGRTGSGGSFSGTHTGDFMGIPPSGEEITVTFLNLDRFADGKLVQHRAQVDTLGLLQQLGAIPCMATA